MLFQESLASLSISSLSFALPTRFCVPECHRNRVESSTAEKVLFFQFSRSPLRANQRDGGDRELLFSVSTNCIDPLFSLIEVNGGRFLPLLIAFRNTATRTHREIKQNRSRTKQEFSREAFSKQIIEDSLTSLSCSSSRATTEWSAIFAFGVWSFVCSE